MMTRPTPCYRGLSENLILRNNLSLTIQLFMTARNGVIVLFCFLLSCQVTNNENTVKEKKPIQLITLDPGHFHAALVQKSMYNNVDSVVHVYAPGGADVEMHLKRIELFNSRPLDPTRWKEEVYTGSDYFEKMLAQKAGNVVVISGNNQKKTESIKRSLEAGLNVLADKPMAIDAGDFQELK